MGSRRAEFRSCVKVDVAVLVPVRNKTTVFLDVKQNFSMSKRKDLGSIPLRLPFLFKKVVVCGQCLVILSLTINETLKWLSSLLILTQKSFCW